MTYDTENIKKIDIVSYLKKQGITPKRNSGRWAFYYSPLGKESNPSFAVDTVKNRFSDFHASKSGDIITLVQALETCSFKDACAILSNGDNLDIKPYIPKKAPSGVKVLSDGEITNAELLDYFIEVRKISEKVLRHTCSQLTINFPYGKAPDRTYEVIGFKNDMGGYECRSSWQKVATSPKGFTTINGNPSKYMIWEGFTDYMSYLTFHDILKPKYKTFVLNGLGMLEVLRPFLGGTECLWYGDNDTPSDNAFNTLKNARDMRYEFSFYGDYNAMIQDLL
jgi:hypothetical protein